MDGHAVDIGIQLLQNVFCLDPYHVLSPQNSQFPFFVFDADTVV